MIDFLHGVVADGLDPRDYPIPTFADRSPERLAADELALTNSVVTFVRQLKAALARARKTPDADTVILANKTKIQRAQQGGPSQSEVSSAKVDAILANMERWRWLPREVGTAYVMVNIPDYTLTVVNDGKPVWSTRIVVGQPGKHATPLLAETMKYITFNPTWNVPPSIIRNEYLPALARDPTALARIGLRIGRNSDGSIRIYHTPDKYLFSKPVRAYSHGCMRVENPDKYAETLLSISQPEERYTVQRLHSLYGRGERNINLKTPIPVYLTYQTVHR